MLSVWIRISSTSTLDSVALSACLMVSVWIPISSTSTLDSVALSTCLMTSVWIPISASSLTNDFELCGQEQIDQQLSNTSSSVVQVDITFFVLMSKASVEVCTLFEVAEVVGLV